MNTRRLRSAVGLLAVLCVGVASPALAQLDGAITAPGANATVMQPFTVSGWVVHATPGGSGTGIDMVRVYGCTPTVCTLWGTATYGQPRPSVAAQYGQQYLNSGYSLTKAGLTPGPIYLKVETRSTVNGAWYLWGYSITVQAGPEHTLELPANGAVVPGALAVKGWAIDASAPSGTGVNAVSVWSHRNYGSGEPGVGHGYATYGANRADVAASHGTRFRYSGYTGSFTLAPGQHYLGISSRSSHTQVWTTRTRNIYVNMPTVPLTIDRPGTGTGGVTATGLSCPGGAATQALPCGASYALHAARTLTAVPDPGSTFAGWGGACSGTGTCQVTMSMARYVTASFTKLPATIDTRYYHTDPIGSVRAITDETGAVVIRHDYRPFGEDVQPLTGDPMRFAGKELDEETGQQYFDARYYRNTWGRFTTVDPIFVGAAMTDPQQWNRYAYARNNPLKWVDPSGLCVDTTIDGETYCVSESVTVQGEGFTGLIWNGTAWCEPGFNQGAFYGFFNCVDRPNDSGGDAGGNPGGGGGGGTLVPVADTVPSTGVVDKVQIALDGVSIGLDATGVGAAASPIVDLVNGGISLVRGDWLGAATSVWAAVPYIGISGNLAKIAARARNVDGGLATTDGALRGAAEWLGDGYTEIAPGVFRSRDGVRQFRMTAGDLGDPRLGPHVHFETIGPDGRAILENSHVRLGP